MAASVLGIPTEVQLVKADLSPRFTPRELDTIKARYGRSLSALMSDEDGDEKLIITAWLRLRREGLDVTLEDMDDVIIGLPQGLGEPEPDPTPVVPDNGSLGSVTSGG